MIIEGKSNTFKNQETKFKINKNLSYNSKNVVYITECSEYIEIFIGSTPALNTKTSQHRSNIKIEENRKLNISKHQCQCSHCKFKIIPIYQTNDYTLLQIKEKNFIDKLKPNLKKTWIVHTQMEINIHIYIYIYIYIYKNLQKHIHTHREIITISEIGDPSNTPTHTTYQISKVN